MELEPNTSHSFFKAFLFWFNFYMYMISINREEQKNIYLFVFFFKDFFFKNWPPLPDIMEVIGGPLGSGVICWIPSLTLGDQREGFLLF